MMGHAASQRTNPGTIDQGYWPNITSRSGPGAVPQFTEVL